MNWFTEGPNGRPWYYSVRWTIIMFTAITIWVVGGLVVMDKAGGAEPNQVVARRGCVTPTQDACPEPNSKKYARKFRHHDYGNSKGVHFSKHVKRLIRRWYANHPNAKRTTATDWWKWPFEAAACSPIFGAGYRVNCENANKDAVVWDRGVHEVSKVALFCGGAAIIGSLKGGGYVGAGKGGGVCLWGVMYKLSVK